MSKKKVIWKYHLSLAGFQTVRIPKRADLLTVVAQHNVPVLYAAVVPTNDLEEIGIFVVMTGYEIPSGPMRHLGTFLIDGDTFVGHVFVGKKI